MSVTASAPELNTTAARALKASGVFWFLTAVAGQWTFVYYLANFYGPTLRSGNFEAWDRNKMLTDGYLAGDEVGNLFFAAHVALAAVVTFGGTLQLVPQIRAYALPFHRWNGRLFLLAAIAAALAGLYLEWVRGTGSRADTGLASSLSTSLNGMLILAFAGLAYRAVRAKNIAVHQRWATRLFLVVNGVWFLRVGFSAWMVLTAGAFDAVPFFSLWSFGSYLLPLAVYELYWRAQYAPAPTQYAVAATVVALTIMMGLGSILAFLIMWRPLLSS